MDTFPDLYGGARDTFPGFTPDNRFSGGGIALPDYWSDTLIAIEGDNGTDWRTDEAGNYPITTSVSVINSSLYVPSNFTNSRGNGSANHVWTGQISEFDSTPQDFTAMGWFRLGSSTTDRWWRAMQIGGKQGTTEPLVDMFWTPPNHGSPDKVHFRLNNEEVYLRDSVASDLTTFKHYAVTYRHATGAWELFVNGVSTDTATKVATFTSDFFFGSGWNSWTAGASGRNWWCGLRLLQRALTPTEVLGHAQAGGLRYLAVPT